MKEIVKSIILVILVSLSIVFTGLLSFYDFNKESISILEYYPQIQVGDELEYQEIIKPKRIYVHFGDNSHTMINNSLSLYDVVDKEMRKWIFYGINEIDSINWVDLLENKKSMEIVFSTPLSFDILKNIFIIGDSIELKSINRVWIISSENETIEVLFISDELDKVYKGYVSILAKTLDYYIDSGKYEIPYSYHIVNEEDTGDLVKKMYYLPNERFTINRIYEYYSTISENDIMNLLFIDPNMIRTVCTKDSEKSTLYTDGNNSLLYNTENNNIIYYKPYLDSENISNEYEDLITGIDYVNNHGGWDKTNILESVYYSNDSNITSIIFNRYILGYRILDKENDIHTINTKVQNGAVIYYSRTMLLINNLIAEPVNIYSGKETLKLIQNTGINLEEIKDIELVYLAEKKSEFIILQPEWLITTKTDEQFEIKAYITE